MKFEGEITGEGEIAYWTRVALQIRPGLGQRGRATRRDLTQVVFEQLSASARGLKKGSMGNLCVMEILRVEWRGIISWDSVMVQNQMELGIRQPVSRDVRDVVA